MRQSAGFPFFALPIVILEFSVMAYIGLLIFGEETIGRALFLGVVIFFCVCFYEVFIDSYEAPLVDGLSSWADADMRAVTVFVPIIYLICVVFMCALAALVAGVFVGICLLVEYLF